MNRKLTANMFWTCINDMSDGCMQGTLYSIMSDEDIVFHDVNQMILQADALMDSIGFPQAFQNKRSFQEEEHYTYHAHLHTNEKREQEDIIQHCGNVFTGIIMVNTRQYSNWQGYVMNEHFERLCEFGDVVELMHQLIELIQKQEIA